jgi:hypothetical protein
MAKPNYDKKLANYRFLQARHLAFVRHRAQCAFRGEEFELSLEDWCDFWPDEQLFARRGRAVDNLMMTRFDVEKSWNRDNCCLVTRLAHFNIKNKRHFGIPYEQYFNGAITIA